MVCSSLGCVLIDFDNLPFLVRGCSVLGTGGGGETHTGSLVTRAALEELGPVEVVALEELPEDALLMPVVWCGGVMVGEEKISSGYEIEVLRDEVEARTGRRVAALVVCEIGGSNGVMAVSWAARIGVPLVDADLAGRAVPRLTAFAPYVLGRKPEVIVLSDERRQAVTICPQNGAWAEALSRAVSHVFGGQALMACYLMSVAEARGALIEGSYTRALQIGYEVSQPSRDPVARVLEVVGGTRIIDGKIVDVERRMENALTVGNVLIQGYGPDTGRLVRLCVQNENLVAMQDGNVLASVPDLITILDAQTAEAIATESIRYGQRVTVIVFPAHPIFCTPAGLDAAGPRAYGYNFDYTPHQAGTHAHT